MSSLLTPVKYRGTFDLWTLPGLDIDVVVVCVKGHLLRSGRISRRILNQILTNLLVLQFLQGIHIYLLLQQHLDQSYTIKYALLYIFIWSRLIWNTKSVILLLQNTLHDVWLCHSLKLNMQPNIISFTSLKDGHIIQSHYLLCDSSLLCPKVE